MLRALVPLLSVALLVPGGSAVAAEGAGAPVEVSAMVETADGDVVFVSRRAESARAGRDLAHRLEARPEVVAADVVQRVRATATGPDPLRDRQWGLSTLEAEELWAAGPASGQVVAVVDSGVDKTHPDLSIRVLPGLDLVAGTGDGSADENGHGTHVAGVVAAVAGNALGGAGLAQGARVLPVRVLDETGSGYDTDVAEGIVWAVDRGATVVNLSLGGPHESRLLTAAVRYAVDRGVVVVASSGNSGDAGDPVLYPAATAGVLAVGAVNSAGVRPVWSSTGAHLGVTAPGVGIVSTVPGGGHASWSGTSMAAPFVAAAAALLRTTEPSLTPAQLRDRLRATAKDLGPVGHDREYGAGRVDVRAARAAGTPVLSSPSAEPITAESSPAPEPSPTAEPAPEPVATEPSPSAEPTPEPTPEPSLAPAPSPAPALVPLQPPAPAPAVVTLRASRSAAVVQVGASVVLAARGLVDGRNTAALPVVLERRVGTGPWTVLRSGSTDAAGLAVWTLRPDRTGEHRVRSGAAVSPVVRVDVRQRVASAARRSGRTAVVDGRVAPGGRTSVALQVLRSGRWLTVRNATTDTAGRVRFVLALPRGTAVRLYARPRTALLAAVSPVRRP